ncbi:MAG TPA: nascent polypeptide-associated complex protein [archaeon]|nr:nascent polypeptide-associated complex protein [archaeon]
MLGKPSPEKIQQMMKKLNMDIRQIDAEEVTIKTKAKNIKIKNPEVMIANMMGRDVYQVSGEVYESLPEEDILLVMDKTGKDRQTVEKKLEELDNDLARAIIELKGK